MIVKDLVGRLDEEFAVVSSTEDLVQWAVTAENRDMVYSEFLEHRTGLMVAGAVKVQAVRTTVFVTDSIVKKLRETLPCLLFTHHNFDYYEDDRGLQPIRPDQIEDLLQHGHSVYVAHASLDTHPIYGTSLALAMAVGITVKERFYNYFGAPVALVGSVGDWDLQAFVEHIRRTLLRPKLDLEKHRHLVQNVAVVAGGGDLPDLLQEAYDRGCDTMLLGTLEHRWAIPAVQEKHKQFRRLNDRLKVNLIGGSHFGTERPAMIRVIELFKSLGLPSEYCEDDELLNVS